MNKYKTAIQDLLTTTDVSINGNRPWDIQVKNEKFYKRVLRAGSLGLGESYMEDWWECDRLDELLYRLFKSDLEKKIKSNFKLKWLVLKARVLNRQTKKRAGKSIASHYDIGNKLFKKMLDPLMVYSCGYWKGAENLTQAQENKLELICKKLQLQPGQKVLDIGCGWGGFAYYCAKYYKTKVTGITISKEQYNFAKKRCEGLDVEIRLQDYRDLNEKYDRIVSIGMLEHVGYKNYKPYMNVVNRNLTNDGVCLLHFIGNNKSEYTTDPWINKYIFSEGLVPSMTQISEAMENKLILQDAHNFGPYYDKTLMAWYHNFKNAWPEIQKSYNELFYKMWEFYLCSAAASFRVKRLPLWQLVVTRKDFPSIYQSVRPQYLSTHEFEKVNGRELVL
ncbi:MAG: cyclopropane fatty acyl phospholipid synthase [Aequorivita sp.]